MIRRLNIRGETLTETIIALSILAISITVASTVILNSMRNLTVAKQRVIAVNIAREGVEALRAIRDTNWLLYSDKRRQCWNNDPEVSPCDGLNPILPGYYVVYKADDETWQLEYADADPLVDGPDDADTIKENDLDLDRIRLSLVDIDPAVDSDGNGTDDDDTDMYNHMNAALASPPPFGTEVKGTVYSRYIIIEYLENQPDISTPPSANEEPEESINTKDEWDASTPSLLNRMRVTSVVEWYRANASFSVELKTIITDHLGREDLTS